jgi:hypothetical protein
MKMYYSQKKEIINFCVEIFILPFVLIGDLRGLVKKYITKNNKSNIDSDSLMILGTGPSLSKAITKLAQHPNKYKYMAVNNFPLSEYFFTLRPSYLCLIDSMYWVDSNKLELSVSKKIKKVYKNLNDVDWEMTLIAPVEAKNSLIKRVKNKNITVEFTRSSRYDFDSVIIAAWSLSLGVLPPRVNVVVTAIYLSVILGYKNIKVIGADMDRIKYLEVDQESNLTGMRIDYFYNDKGARPLLFQHKLKEGKGLPVHIKLMRESSTFKWFALVNSYSKNRGVNLCNASEFSLIDSIERCEI